MSRGPMYVYILPSGLTPGKVMIARRNNKQVHLPNVVYGRALSPLAKLYLTNIEENVFACMRASTKQPGGNQKKHSGRVKL